MKRLNKNNKGFTLIELLAVIVILGVLMIIAIPMVSKYIKESKQSAFIQTAKAYISSARYAYLNGDYTGNTCTNLDSGTGGSVYIKFKYIPVDKAGGQSSFNKKILKEYSYVRISSDSNGRYTYYVYMVDEGGNVIMEKEEEKLERKDVVTGGKTDGAVDTYKANSECTSSYTAD